MIAPFAVLSFSRIAPQDVLDNPTRRRVMAAVETHPGMNLQELRSATGAAWGTLVHHLRRLERAGLASSVRAGHSRRVFPASARDRAHAALLVEPRERALALAVAAHPGIGQSDLCNLLAMRGPNASKGLAVLIRAGLVASQRVGRRRHYTACAGLELWMDRLRTGTLGAVMPAPGQAVTFVRLDAHRAPPRSLAPQACVRPAPTNDAANPPSHEPVAPGPSPGEIA